MLSSVGWTRHRQVRPGRRGSMQQQELFPTRPEPAEERRVWNRIRREDRIALIRALARLMMDALRPQAKGGGDER
jgi:hypothetical protein